MYRRFGNFEVSVREAIALLVLFASQVLAEIYIIQTYSEPAATEISIFVLYAYTAVYAVLGAVLIMRRESVKHLVSRTITTARGAIWSDTEQAE